MDVQVNGMFEMTLKLKFQILLSQDSGKLQTLDILLKRLRAENHRVLLFAQMTKMLNIIEVPSLSLSLWGSISRREESPFGQNWTSFQLLSLASVVSSTNGCVFWCIVFRLFF